MAVDNTLSPHGGELKVSVAGHGDAGHSPNGLPRLPVRDQIAREVVNLSYGFFSPLNGFMDRRDVDSVVRRMTLADGTVWSIPIVFDVSAGVLAAYGLQTGGRVLLTYQDQPLAVLEISDIFDYDRDFLAQQVYGTADASHPGVERTNALDDTFIGGPVTLINPPSINPPFDRFWKTPQQLRERFAQRDWRSVVAHQTRNVPHSGHEWLMKGAWLAAEAYGEVGGEHKGILVSAVIGEKKPGDYIDEAIVLAHQRLRDDGFFRPDVHLVSTLLWDMRYAGPREAVFHALVRKNLGCTHHMFGRDHAGVGTYYDTYAAHEIFQQLPDLGIKSVLTREWWYCPACAGVAYEGLCGHPEQRQELSGTYIRSIIQGGVEPAPLTLRPEVLEVVRECAEQYGFGSPFVGDQYLDSRTPVMTMPIVEGFCCTCSGT
jgi:sulfate adenylyltransferase